LSFVRAEGEGTRMSPPAENTGTVVSCWVGQGLRLGEKEEIAPGMYQLEAGNL